MSIGKVNFDTGSSRLKPSAQTVLNRAAALIIDRGYSKVNLAGFTDIRGSASLNLRLSRDRALAVQRYLEKRLGDTKVSFNVAYYAAANPVATGNSPSALAANRRVEIFIP